MPDHATSTDPAVQAQLDRLTMLSPGKDVLGLERIATLLDRLGNPHHHLPPVLVLGVPLPLTIQPAPQPSPIQIQISRQNFLLV